MYTWWGYIHLRMFMQIICSIAEIIIIIVINIHEQCECVTEILDTIVKKKIITKIFVIE